MRISTLVTQIDSNVCAVADGFTIALTSKPKYRELGAAFSSNAEGPPCTSRPAVLPSVAAASIVCWHTYLWRVGTPNSRQAVSRRAAWTS